MTSPETELQMANWILQQEGLPFFPQLDAVLHPELPSTKTSVAEAPPNGARIMRNPTVKSTNLREGVGIMTVPAGSEERSREHEVFGCCSADSTPGFPSPKKEPAMNRSLLGVAWIYVDRACGSIAQQHNQCEFSSLRGKKQRDGRGLGLREKRGLRENTRGALTNAAG